LQQLPIESLLPILVLKHLGSIASKFEIQPKYIEYGYDPDSNLGTKTKFAKKKQHNLKEIDS
jgi:hypothetical protein